MQKMPRQRAKRQGNILYKIEDIINKIHCADCLDFMQNLPDNCIDTIICDPPYGLSFMGKKWDYDVPSVELWRECLRVLKCGGTLLCFAGSRTQHRMAVNVEDAGFILKDCIMWLYGSGFPKATDISKQLDKGHKREVIGDNPNARPNQEGKQPNTMGGVFQYTPLTKSATPEAKLWNGWKSHGLKPAYEPILVAMKPNGEPALDIFEAVVYTLAKKGFGDISWAKKPVKNVTKQKTSTSSTRTKPPRTEETSVENVKRNEMRGQEQNTEQAYSHDSEQGTRQAQEKSKDIIEDNRENLENKYLKNTERSVSVVGKQTKSSSRLTTLTEKGNNIEIESEKQGSMRICEEEDFQKTITDSCATTVISLLGVTDTALTITFENKEYTIEILSEGSFVWPLDLPKYRKARSLTYAENALKHGVSGLNIDGSRIGVEEMGGGTMPDFRHIGKMSKDSIGVDKLSFGQVGKANRKEYVDKKVGRFPANVILDDEVTDEEWSRFFKNIKISEICFICCLPTDESSGIMNEKGESLCNANNVKQSLFRIEVSKDSAQSDAVQKTQQLDVDKKGLPHNPVRNVGLSSKSMQAISENTAQSDATLKANEQLVQNVKSAGSLCERCATAIAQSIVAMQQGRSRDLPLGKAFISEHKEQILTQNLALLVESQENTDTIPTIAALKLLFGSVQNAIENSIVESTIALSPSRFRYVSKASKRERNAGCEGMEAKDNLGYEIDPEHPYKSGHRNDNNADQLYMSVTGKPPIKKHNHHPTVKPLALMEYLCTLTKTPTGGLVLDPFCGSGTTCIACINTERDFIGIEKTPEYVEIAKHRIKSAKEKYGLFE